MVVNSAPAPEATRTPNPIDGDEEGRIPPPPPPAAAAAAAHIIVLENNAYNHTKDTTARLYLAIRCNPVVIKASTGSHYLSAQSCRNTTISIPGARFIIRANRRSAGATTTSAPPTAASTRCSSPVNMSSQAITCFLVENCRNGTVNSRRSSLS